MWGEVEGDAVPPQRRYALLAQPACSPGAPWCPLTPGAQVTAGAGKAYGVRCWQGTAATQLHEHTQAIPSILACSRDARALIDNANSE